MNISREQRYSVINIFDMTQRREFGDKINLIALHVNP